MKTIDFEFNFTLKIGPKRNVTLPPFSVVKVLTTEKTMITKI